MPIVTPSSPEHQLDQKPRYRSRQEMELRALVETWGRAKWPEARVVHELVMGRGTVRADVVFVSPTHFATVEIKSDFDDTSRLITQAAMFRLASPELWLVNPQRHARDAALVRYLLPSLGLAEPDPPIAKGVIDPLARLTETAAAAQFEPDARAELSLLWVSELTWEAKAMGLTIKGSWTHDKLIKALSDVSVQQRRAMTCRQLRARQALWRADPAIPLPGAGPAPS